MGGAMKSKSIFKSKTIWGIAIAALPTLLNLFGVVLPPELAEIINIILVGAGSSLGIYGRVSAKERVRV
jgi:hypothetical protein